MISYLSTMSESTSLVFHQTSVQPKVAKPKSRFLHNNMHSFTNLQSHKTKQWTYASLQSSSPSGNTPFQTNSSPHINIPTKSTKSFFSKIIAPPLHPSVDPTHVFSGNFAPVTELAPTDCTIIEGEIPASLNGFFIRNGPNPQQIPPSALHLFDGDGMLHCLKLSNGRATYCSRYVKTYKYVLEREAGFPIFPNMLSGFYGPADIAQYLSVVAKSLIGNVNPLRGFGTANTSVVLFSNKLLALSESDLPYIMNLTAEGDIETVGRWDFDNKLFASMTAHPKIDVDTNEVFCFSWNPFFPYLTYFYFDDNGVKQNEVPITSVHQPGIFHDFAVTKRFAIFPENQFVLARAKVILGRGMPAVCKPNKVPRIGVLPKYATSDKDMKWFSVPGFNTIHVLNAWENGEDEIVLVAPNIKNLENVFHNVENIYISLEKVTINIRTGIVSRHVLSTRKNLEMGTVNDLYAGKKNRYAYLGVGEMIPKMSGIVKVDLEKECEVSTRFYGPNCFGGEPFFVPRDRDNIDSDEDEGYIISYVHNEISGESKFLVMDAKSPKLDIIAAIKLPRRVPYGFHGLFIEDKNLPN